MSPPALPCPACLLLSVTRRHDYDLCESCFKTMGEEGADYNVLHQPVYRPAHSAAMGPPHGPHGMHGPHAHPFRPPVWGPPCQVGMGGPRPEWGRATGVAPLDPPGVWGQGSLPRPPVLTCGWRRGLYRT